MPPWEQTVARHRTTVLGGIMVVILLASVALAAWLARQRRLAIGEAVEVLQEIRLRKLPAFWGRDAVTDWYLHRDPDGGPVGWSTVQRTPTGDGYSGRHIRRRGATLDRETWSIDAAARTGSYFADSSILIPAPGRRTPLLRRVSSTSIELRGGRVQVRREAPGGVAAATAEAPENYVPEGLLRLACYRAAAGQRRADFITVLNDHAVAAGEVRFSPVHVSPRGPSAVRVRFAGPDPQSEQILQFDQDGRVLRGQSVHTGTYFEAVELQEVRRIFPEVELFAARRPRGSPAASGAAGEP
jgi:hypothetical protein